MSKREIETDRGTIAACGGRGGMGKINRGHLILQTGTPQSGQFLLTRFHRAWYTGIDLSNL